MSGHGGLARDVSIVASVAGISFMNSFFSGALTVSLPTIQKDLSISAANLTWGPALYALVLGAFLLPMGRLADIYTHRRLFLIGTAFFAAVSIAIALSPTWIVFTMFVAILALGAAANTPAGVGVIGNHFEAGEGKNRSFAILGAGQPVGFITGLVVGALLTQTKVGWRASFYAQAGLSAVFFIVGFFTIPSHFSVPTSSIPLTDLSTDGADSDSQKPESVHPSSNRRLDWLGTFLSVSGLVLLTFTLADAQAEPRGWKTPFLPPLLPVSLAIISGFFYWERRLAAKGAAFAADPDSQGVSPPPPLLPPQIWRAPFFAVILATVFFAWASFNTSSYYINLVMQSVILVTPLKTAIYFLPMIVSGTILNIVPGFLLGKVSGTLLICLSMGLSLVGPILVATIDPEASYWHFLFPIMVFTPAPDLCYAIAAVQISKSVSRSEQATAGALFNVVTRLATAISLGLISTGSTTVSTSYLLAHPTDPSTGLPNTSQSPAVLLAGYRVAAWACAASAAVGFVIAVAGLRGMGIVGRKEEPVDALDDGAGDVAQGPLTRRRGRREDGDLGAQE